MARIRSIKPEFFTSETIALQPLSARLTFIGLWTYVDDNGVGLDNERLIVAAIWPLERDAIEAVQRTRDDLRSLSGAKLITRYRAVDKSYLYITAWDEHQKVSHPRKTRYPQPHPFENHGLTSTPAILPNDSGNPPEPLRPEQGAGSREQGAGKTTAGVINSNVEIPPTTVLNGKSDFDSFAPDIEAERRRQMDALMREYPEVAQ
jgi:hypothetical protein